MRNLLRKRSLTVSLLCLLSLFTVVTMPQTVAYSQPLLEVEVSEYYLTAGDENQIEIFITNVGEGSAYEVKASLTVPQTVSGIAIVKESHRVFDEIEEEEAKHMYPMLYVASSCPPGAYSLTFGLEYYDAAPRVVDREQHVSSIQIGIIVLPLGFTFKVEVERYRIRAGIENEITIALTNTGGTSVYEVDARLSSASPNIAVLKERFTTFDVIKPKSSVYFIPTLGVSRSTPLGAYSLTLTLKYKDLNGTSRANDLPIEVFVDSVEPVDRITITVQGLQITPSEVHPGDNLTVEMELRNLGADAYDVQAQLTIGPQIPLVSLSPTLVFVGDLGSNKAAKIIYDLQVSGDAKAQPYTLQLAVSHYDMYGQPSSITENISIDVRSIMSFRLVNVQPSSLTLEPGEMVTVEADLLLIGTESAQFVQVEILENPPFISFSESYEYIGRVDPDSPVPFDVQFMVDSNATPGNHRLQMRVSFWDEYNREHQEITELPVVIGERVEQRQEEALTSWDMIWRMIRILLGVKP